MDSTDKVHSLAIGGQQAAASAAQPSAAQRVAARTMTASNISASMLLLATPALWTAGGQAGQGRNSSDGFVSAGES